MSTINERTVSEAFRKNYLATGKHADAWNQTLEDLAGSALSPKRGEVADLLRKVADPIMAKLRGKVKQETVTLDVHPLDVWGNAREGYFVNDVYPSRGSITIPIDAHHDEIVRALKREGFIDRNIHLKSVEVEGENEYHLDISDKKGVPVYQLRARAGSSGSSGASGGGGARFRYRRRPRGGGGADMSLAAPYYLVDNMRWGRPGGGGGGANMVGPNVPYYLVENARWGRPGGGGGGARARTKADRARLSRPSPTAHAVDHKGECKRGHDGRLWCSVPDKNRVYHWKRV